MSIARKGSNAWRDSRRRESIARRASMPLGGMRVITTGGVTAGLDASLYLVGYAVLVGQGCDRRRDRCLKDAMRCNIRLD
jgi:hypothetical protein